MAKRARTHIATPEVPLDLILARSQNAGTRGRLRTLVLAFALPLAMIGTAAAFKSSVFDGVRFWLLGNKTAVSINSFATVNEPTAEDLQSITARATFPVVLPVGLPAGMHVSRMQFAPVASPNMLSLDYRNNSGNVSFGITLFGSSAADANISDVPAANSRMAFQNTYRWRTKNESVLILRRVMSLQNAEQIKAAMMQKDPSESFVETKPTLSRATILGTAPELPKIAQSYAPSSGRSVVVGRQPLASVPELAKRDAPMLDTHIVYLTNIPLIHGAPDYANATLHWPRVVAISSGGVRALNAVLRSTGAQTDCNCFVLFMQPNPRTYEVWKFARGTPALLKKYSVDAKTLAVKAHR
ncbi:MAG: hypothetical protein M3126_11455 [Candidatus Eremiobacteraeota bacterium]|nr:hypothetical protein [Candidatus Eremiobacteraeota bacterium]